MSEADLDQYAKRFASVINNKYQAAADVSGASEPTTTIESRDLIQGQINNDTSSDQATCSSESPPDKSDETSLFSSAVAVPSTASFMVEGTCTPLFLEVGDGGDADDIVSHYSSDPEFDPTSMTDSMLMGHEY